MVGLTAGSGLSPLPACRSALGYGFIFAFVGMFGLPLCGGTLSC